MTPTVVTAGPARLHHPENPWFPLTDSDIWSVYVITPKWGFQLCTYPERTDWPPAQVFRDAQNHSGTRTIAVSRDAAGVWSWGPSGQRRFRVYELASLDDAWILADWYEDQGDTVNADYFRDALWRATELGYCTDPTRRDS